MTALVDEIAATGGLHAEYRGIRFTVVPVAPALTVDGDPQLLTSAVMNLLHNAFKNTPAGAHGGHIHIRNLPGEGCIFTVDVPLAAENARVPQSV